MFLLSFLLNKAVLIGLSLVVVGSTTVYGGIKAVEYRDTQISLQEAKQLSSEGKYQEAINKLNTTKNKWSTSETKEEVKQVIEDNKNLIESTKNYQLGKELFDKGKFDDSIQAFKKVDSRNTNYIAALETIKLAEENIEKVKEGEQKKVLGTNTTKTPTLTSKAVGGIVSPTLSPEPTPTTPIDSDPLVDCKYTGGSVKMRSSECKKQVNCEVGNGWVLATKDKCTQLQLDYDKQNPGSYELFLRSLDNISGNTPSTNNNVSNEQYTPDPAVEQARKAEDCRNQKTNLDQQKNSNIESENLSYERALSTARTNYADNGLYDSGSRYSSEGLITSNHNDRLQSIESQYNSQLSQLRAQGCNF